MSVYPASMPVAWPDEVDEVLTGDITAALAYVTPAGGAVVTAVAPIGLRDRDAGTVTFTTSLGFGRKLDRMQRDPSVALAYHAREHGFATGSAYVLVQGKASITKEPDRDYLETVVRPQSERFMGPPREGLFWDRWLREYYSDRVPVTVAVERVTWWPDKRCEGSPSTAGAPRAEQTPSSQESPGKGTAPRVDAGRAARRIARTPHKLVGFVDADGLPFVAPVEADDAGAEGIRLSSSAGLLPPGARRAGLLAHGYGPQLVAITARQHTGWLEVPDRGGDHGLYSPHTEQGFRAPSNKTLLLLANGLLAKRGLKKARRASAPG